MRIYVGEIEEKKKVAEKSWKVEGGLSEVIGDGHGRYFFFLSSFVFDVDL
jgi:hypothetical protein